LLLNQNKRHSVDPSDSSFVVCRIRKETGGEKPVIWTQNIEITQGTHLEVKTSWFMWKVNLPSQKDLWPNVQNVRDGKFQKK
jgi:hypothetical protein